jgi:hypothetical protein
MTCVYVCVCFRERERERERERRRHREREKESKRKGAKGRERERECVCARVFACMCVYLSMTHALNTACLYAHNHIQRCVMSNSHTCTSNTAYTYTYTNTCTICGNTHAHPDFVDRRSRAIEMESMSASSRRFSCSGLSFFGSMPDT